MISPEKRFDISVVVPTYNRSELLEYTLRSLQLQTISNRQFEVVVADDGSSDNTKEIIDAYRDKMNLKYVFQADEGYRVGSARNKAICLSEGDLCLFIDAGIILNTNALEKHIGFHRVSGPDIAAVGYIYGFDREGEAEIRLKHMINPDDPAGSIHEISKHEIYFDIREQHYRRHRDQIELLPAPWIYFWAGHVSVKKDHLERVGMFDERYDGRWGVEDNDLGFRLNRHGIRIRLLREAQCIHYPHNTHKPEKERQGRENCRYFHSKFETLETELFMRHYGEDDLIDINVLSRQMLSKLS